MGVSVRAPEVSVTHFPGMRTLDHMESRQCSQEDDARTGIAASAPRTEVMDKALLHRLESMKNVCTTSRTVEFFLDPAVTPRGSTQWTYCTSSER